MLQDTYKLASGGYSDSAVADSRQDYAYAWRDGPVQSAIGNDNDNDGDIDWTTTYAYDAWGRASSVSIQDGRPRTVSLVADQAGMIVDRDEADTLSGGDPRTLRYAYAGIVMGEATNNGTSNMNYAASIADRLAVTPSTPGAFRNGATTHTSHADFEQSYDAINPGSQSGAGGSYTVGDGDTLHSIAMAVWGDAQLWYLIAETNGLHAGSQLIAGQSLLIPNKVANAHNDSRTFKPYDPAGALGDTTPNAIKPAKKNNCAAIGQILLVVIAVAVTIATSGAAAAGMGFASSIGGGIGALAAGKVGFVAAVAAGAIGGAAGSIASQGVGVATGIQSKFSWKGVAMSALSGAINGGVGASGMFANVGSKFAQGALSAGLSSTITQGIAVATGLQSKFDWAGVAAAGIGGGVSSHVAGKLAPAIRAGTIGANVANGLSAVTGGLANAGARSIVNGTSFGDNLIAALPDVIGNTIGELVAGGITGRGQPADSTDYDGDGIVSRYEQSDSHANAVVAMKDARYAAEVARKESEDANTIALKESLIPRLVITPRDDLQKIVALGPLGMGELHTASASAFDEDQLIPLPSPFDGISDQVRDLINRARELDGTARQQLRDDFNEWLRNDARRNISNAIASDSTSPGAKRVLRLFLSAASERSVGFGPNSAEVDELFDYRGGNYYRSLEQVAMNFLANRKYGTGDLREGYRATTIAIPDWTPAHGLWAAGDGFQMGDITGTPTYSIDAWVSRGRVHFRMVNDMTLTSYGGGNPMPLMSRFVDEPSRGPMSRVTMTYQWNRPIPQQYRPPPPRRGR